MIGVVTEVFGLSTLGVYLHGSAMLGGMRPTSDVDVLAVVDLHSTTGDRRALIAALMPISGAPVPGTNFRPVELTVVTQSEIRPWRYPPRMEFQYGEWLKDDYRAGLVPEPAPNPDLAPLLTLARSSGRALVGPPASELIDPVPAADLRRAIVAGVPELMADLEPDTRNVLLTLGRIWVTLATGEIVSKDAAAEWAAERLSGGPAAVMREARDQYLSGTHGDWSSSIPSARAAAGELAARISASN